MTEIVVVSRLRKTHVGDIVGSLIAEAIEMPIVRSFSVGVPASSTELRIDVWLRYCSHVADEKPTFRTKFRQIYVCSNYYLPLIDRSCHARPIVICLRMSDENYSSLLIDISSHSHMPVLTKVRSAEMP